MSRHSGTLTDRCGSERCPDGHNWLLTFLTLTATSRWPCGFPLQKATKFGSDGIRSKKRPIGRYSSSGVFYTLMTLTALMTVVLSADYDRTDIRFNEPRFLPDGLLVTGGDETRSHVATWVATHDYDLSSNDSRRLSMKYARFMN